MRLPLAILLCLLAVTAVVADDAKEAEPAAEAEALESVGALLKRIEDAQKDHKDFQGNFEQSRFLPLFGDTINSSGRFAFKKPDHVRWEYTKPHKSILVVRGDRGHKWSESTRRVEDFRLAEDRGLDAVVKQLFTWFKGEFTKLNKDYDVEITSREPLALTMKPKSQVVQRFIASIEVRFSKDESRIESVKLTEPLAEGDEQAGYTLYKFSDTKLDAGIQDKEFRIEQ